MKLSQLKEGDHAVLSEILCKPDLRYRLIDMGLTENSRITCLMKNLGKESFAYLIGDCVIALRREDADNIKIQVDP